MYVTTLIPNEVKEFGRNGAVAARSTTGVGRNAFLRHFQCFFYRLPRTSTLCLWDSRKLLYIRVRAPGFECFALLCFLFDQVDINLIRVWDENGVKKKKKNTTGDHSLTLELPFFYNSVYLISSLASHAWNASLTHFISNHANLLNENKNSVRASLVYSEAAVFSLACTYFRRKAIALLFRKIPRSTSGYASKQRSFWHKELVVGQFSGILIKWRVNSRCWI